MATELEELERITKAMNPVGLPNFANQARNQLPVGDGTVLAPITPTVEIDLSGLPNQTPEEDEVEILNLGYIKNPDGSYSKKTTFSTPEPTPESKTATQEMVDARAMARGGFGMPGYVGLGNFTPVEGSLPDLIGRGVEASGNIFTKGVETSGNIFNASVPVVEKMATNAATFLTGSEFKTRGEKELEEEQRLARERVPVETTYGIPAPTQVAQPTAVPAQPAAVLAQPAAAPDQPTPVMMDGSQIPQQGEEGFKFAEPGSPQSFFLSQTNDGTTPLSFEQIPTAPVTQPSAAPSGITPPTAQLQGGSGGIITRDKTGDTYLAGAEGLNLLSPEEAAIYKDNARPAGTIRIQDGEGNAVNPNANRFSPENQTSEMQANVAAGRPPNVSAGQVEAAQQAQARQMQAAAAQQAMDSVNTQMETWKQSNPNATPAMQQQAIQQFTAIAMQGAEQPAGKFEGLTFDQKLALRKQNFVEDVAKLEWDKSDEETKIKRVDEMNTEIAALNSAIDQGKTVQDVGERAQRGINWRTAGFFSPLRFVGGTDAASLEGNLETIKADAFVSNITDMRNNSPTGGSVGNVSDADLLQMQSLQRSFQQKQAPKDLKRNISEYLKIRNRVIERTSKRFIRTYGQENFDKYFGNNATGSSNTGGSSSSIPNDRDVPSKADSFLLPPSK